MNSSFSFNPDIDDSPESNVDQDGRPGTYSSKSSSNRSRIRVLSKAKEGFDKIQAKYRMENIPLSLVKQDIQQGQEWIKGAMFCAWGTALITVLNIILTIIAVGIAYSKKTGDKHFTYAELYQGDCSLTSNWATGMHLVINALGALLLAASNYVMQCLSAPSRVDVDKAHSNSNSLDIGVLSLRNMWIMSAQRKALWGLLLISSLPIHMLYNTAIFSSISNVQYGIAVIPSDLGRNESLVKDEYEAQSFYKELGSTPEDVLAEIFNGTFRSMSLADCSSRYNKEFNTEAGAILFLTDRENLHDSSSQAILDRYFWMRDMTQPEVQLGSEKWNYPAWSFKTNETDDWGALRKLCPSWSPDRDEAACMDVSNDILTLSTFMLRENPSEVQLGDFLSTTSNWQNSSWASGISFRIDAPVNPIEGYYARGQCYCSDSPEVEVDSNITVSGCMTSDAEQHCGLYFSLPISIAVVACNVVKFLCMYGTAKTKRRDIFLTVGDAVSSFLDRPDETTRRDFLFPSKRKRWLQAASWRRWAFTYILFSICLGASIFLCFLAMTTSGIGFSKATKLGIGKPSGDAFIEASRDQGLIALALLANSPQLVFSTLYLVCNGVLTCMLAVAEYNDFATQRKPLRVSYPRGEQRSTYYLSLPYRYSIPLITVSVLMHWLLSQCIFLVKVVSFDVYRQLSGYAEACGYSPLAMLITVIVGAVAMIFLFGLSLRPLKSNLPLLSSCSTAISAACHPPPGDEDAAVKPVMWGDVGQDSSSSTFSYQSTLDDRRDDYTYCTFTSKEVTTPSTSRLQS